MKKYLFFIPFLFLIAVQPVFASGWRTVSGRAVNTWYQNTGTTDLYVNPRLSLSVGGLEYLDVSSSTAAVEPDFMATCYTSSTAHICDPWAVVPAGYYYQIEDYNSATLQYWNEYQTIESTTTQVVDNPTQDYFYGILLFLLVVGWIANYFSRQIHG